MARFVTFTTAKADGLGGYRPGTVIAVNADHVRSVRPRSGSPS